MAGDANEIWRVFHRRLRAFIARRVEHAADVEDILQEVFLRVHRCLAAVRDDSRLTAWIYRITHNAISDHFRARARRRETPAGLAEEMASDGLEADRFVPGLDGDQATLRRELAACLGPMIERLPRQYRDAITLVELDGVTQLVAAGRLGLSLSGVKSRVQRGRHKLKRMLQVCCRIQLDRRGGIADYEVRDPSCRPCGSTPGRET
jgi:RNA polymerase sigma-70 factor, ECF subfamily